nr:carbohydrate sulfotransferase 11-like [Cherax quadricarinatus]
MTSPKSPKEESVAKISPEEDELEEKAERPMSHKEVGYVNDIYVEDYTPQDFVEVKKLHPVTSKVKAPGKKPAVASQRRPSPQSMPHTLRERALTFSNTSALWKFLKEQERRAQHVKATCQERFFPMVDLREWMHGPPRALLGAKDIIYDSANHLAFCPVYKAASTSWSITLLELGGYWRESLKKKNSLQLLLKQIFPRISNFAASSITSDCTRFMVVRHPFERLVSCYRDKFQDASKGYYYLHYGEKMVRRYRKFHDGLSQQQISLLEEQVRSKVKRGLPVVLPENPFATPLGPTFSEFVQYILDAHHDDEHWRTYEAHCSPCILPYDFILRFESLPEEGKLFLEYLNRTGDVRPRWDNPTQGVKTGQVACSYFKQLPLPYVHMLYEKYKSDFDLYEYSPDDYFRCAKDAKPLSTVPGRTRREEKRSS